MKLSDLTPKKVDFTVSELKLTFRPFTIADDLKGQELCGGQNKLAEAFQNYDFAKISLIAWYQLTIESQKNVLKSVEGSYIDPETGDEIDANLKPIDKFRALFVGVGDQISLIVNLMNCKGLNIPDLDDDESLKKWVDQLDVLKSTGQ